MWVFRIDTAVLLYLHHARPLLLTLLGQVHPEVLARPVTSRNISVVLLDCTDIFCSRDSMHPTVMRYSRDLLEFLYLQDHPSDRSLLCCHEVHGCPSLLSHPVQQQIKLCWSSVSHRPANVKRWSVRYRFSSCPRIVKARSSRVSLNGE